MGTKAIRINVTLRDVKMGMRHEPKGCPIALAAIRKGLMNPYICSTHISFGKSGHRKRRMMSPEARMFVRAFDSPAAWESTYSRPFTFTIKV